MRALITGAGGALGSALAQTVPSAMQSIALPRTLLDITDPETIAHQISQYRPEVILNAAALTDVDGAEGHPEQAAACNTEGARNLAVACREAGICLIHISTDYVFPGTRGEPYVESDEPMPINVYGRTKLAGEEEIRSSECRHLIVRTSWLYGMGNRRSFAHRVLSWAQEYERLELVTEHLGSPTYAPFLARALWGLAEKGLTGTLHWAGAGRASRFEFGLYLIEEARRQGAALKAKEIDAAPAARFPLKAPRPPDTSLASNRLAAEAPDLMPAPWKKMATAFVKDWAATGATR